LIFLDASVLLAVEATDEPHHADAIELLTARGALGTLDLAAYETANVAIRRWQDRAAADRLVARVLAMAELGVLVRADAELLASASTLAQETGLTVYDAAYVAAARGVDALLASCDERDLVDRGLAKLPGEALAG
jgi:predicted nucleic acid-binding protein